MRHWRIFYREHPSPLTLRRDKESSDKREQRAESNEARHSARLFHPSRGASSPPVEGWPQAGVVLRVRNVVQSFKYKRPPPRYAVLLHGTTHKI